MKEQMKNQIKKIHKYALTYLILVIVFLAGLIFSYLLPNDSIRKHVSDSLPVFQMEGQWAYFGTGASTLDQHTDALMLNIAMNKGENNDIKNAVENSFYEDEKQGGVSSLIEATQDGIVNNKEYSRYWHGIQVFLRPLLIFFNYTEIRYILMLVIFILLGITFAMIGKQLGIKNVIVFAITISFMYVALIPVSLQYSSIFIVTLVSMIGVLLLYRLQKEKYITIVFLIIGALATYFDLLTYPLVTLGFPLILALIIENRRGMSLKKQIIFIIKLGILWAIGYALLFVTKWIVSSIILGKNVINTALDQLLFRVNGSEQYPVSRIDTIVGNFEYFFIPVAKQILLVFTLIWGVLLLIYRKTIKECKIVVPLICISVVPYVWYLAFSGHSSIHSWFTNKIQAMTLFAILSIYVETINFRKGCYLKWKK